MKRKRKLRYWIANGDPNKWWSTKIGKWVELPTTEETGNLNNHRYVKTLDKAIKVSCMLPKGTIIYRMYYHKGNRYIREYEW